MTKIFGEFGAIFTSKNYQKTLQPNGKILPKQITLVTSKTRGIYGQGYDNTCLIDF